VCRLSVSEDGTAERWPAATADLVAALDAIDSANAADPTSAVVRGEHLPLALVHGVLADEWVQRLVPGADDALRLAARAHHLRRWELPRSDYPEGRSGYLKWRRDQKVRHARDVEGLLVAAGYAGPSIARVQALIRRDELATDPDTKAVEDAACLVFLETQLTSVANRLDSARLGEVIRKTASKMTPAGQALIAELPLSDAERGLLATALAAG
jgi:hypothetical protein